MTLILAGKLANNLLRAGATDDGSLSMEQCDRLVSTAYPTVREMATVRSALGAGTLGRYLERKGMGVSDQIAAGIFRGPLEVVCSQHGHVAQSSSLVVHYCSVPLIAGSLRRVIPELGLGAEVYVVSPALALILEARHLGFGGIVTEGMGLCGTYASGIGRMNHCCYDVPLSTTLAELVKDIKAIVRRSEDSHGRTRRAAGLSRCLGALPFILENSASPMESTIAATLAIPTSRGGWGVEGLSLNTRVNLSEEEACIAGQPFIKPDGLVAEAHVGYEYDSRQFHSDGSQSLRDRMRVTSAQFGGIKLLPLTWDVVRSESRFTDFCAEFSKSTGKRMRPLNERTLLRRHELRRELGLPMGDFVPERDPDDFVPLDVYERDEPWLVA